MTKLHAARSIHALTRLPGVALVCVCVLLLGAVPPAHAAGVTWFVTSASDSASDGDLMTHSGSLRFALTHATSGDFVSFDQLNPAIVKIIAASTLTVPDGVTVGHGRDQDCGSYKTPLVNIGDLTFSVKPLISLGAGSTLRNVNIGGGDISLKITGPNADVCGVGLGLEYYRSETGPFAYPVPPRHAALIVDGDHAAIHRNYINGAVVVTTRGSDTRIGDTLEGNNDGNDGVRAASVTVLASQSSAAQRVTIRDPFPRGLHGLVGNGVPGGDDDPTHANNWAQTPTIISAYTYDNFATVQVRGIANPLSLVDIYLDNQLTVARLGAVMADANGAFSFSEPLPAQLPQALVIAASTLNDPLHPNRVGSSSQWSSAKQILPQHTTELQLAPAALTFVAPPGGPPPPPQHLTVTPPSSCPTLSWQTSVTTTDGLNWLSALPVLGSGPGTITVTVDPGSLAVGVYTGTVTVASLAQPADRATAVITLEVQLPLLSALGAVTDLSGPPGGPARPGDLLRFSVAMTNVGSVEVTNINSTNVQLPPGYDVVVGSGTIQGEGTGFVVTDSGFSGGTLAPGKSATYSLDVRVPATVSAGVAVLSMEVNADMIVSIPVVGRMRILPDPGAALQPMMWLPIVSR